MRKIAEEKALEAYPIQPSPYYGDEQDRNLKYRFGFIKGYDQAMQYFLEEVEDFLYLQLNNGSIECGNIERLIEQFKNYIQNE